MDALPFKEAVANLQKKGLLPTTLSSAQIRQLDGALKRQSVFSARTTIDGYLGEIKKTVASIIEPKQVTRMVEDEAGNMVPATQTVTEGYNPATARAQLRDTLKKFGYAPDDEDAGTIKDLSSDARLNLVVKTNTELAQGAGAFIQQNLDPDVVDEYPALELVRYEDRVKVRDWESRWQSAAAESGDTDAARVLNESGRMIALKASPIWDSLGNGAGGYDDTLGNPFPPFAFNSGMWTEDVSRADAVDLRLIKEGQAAQPAQFDLSELFAEVTA